VASKDIPVPMHAPVDALLPAIILLAAGLLSIGLAKLLKTSAIVGFLISGIAMGPGGFGIVTESETTKLLAELGVVFLLFEIGTHFSLKEVWEQRKDLFTLAPFQCLLCGIGFAGIANLFGLGWPIAIAIGGALALSSTAVVARVLQDRGQTSCPLGKSAIGVLVFQDILAVFLLIYAGSLGGAGTEAAGGVLGLMAGAAVKAVIGFALAATIGPLLLKPIFDWFARNRIEDVFTIAALLLVLAMSLASAAMSLSLTLGAFLAGMMIAATPFRHVIQTEVKPFRGLLLGFFFISIGMLLKPSFLLDNAIAIVAVTAGLILVKTALVWLAAKAAKWSTPGAIQLGFLISQGSELAFVVLAMPALREALPAGWPEILIAAIALSLAVTPIVSGLGMKIARGLARQNAPSAPTPAPAAAGTAKVGSNLTQTPALVVGMNAIGRRVVDAFREFGIAHQAVELDQERFQSAIADGYDVVYGDSSDLRLVQTLGLGDTRLVAIAAPRFEVSQSMSPTMQAMFPEAQRYVAVAGPAEFTAFEGLGMRPVINRPGPEGIDLAARILSDAGIDAVSIAHWIEGSTKAETTGEASPLALAV
jgi:Kef-type K+ transport system membrane component KefB